MSSNSKRAELHGALFIAADDDVGMKFYRAAFLVPWPGRSMAALAIAAWLIENMRWKSGEVFRHTSVRHLMTLTGLARMQVDDGLAALVAARLIKRTYIGQGKRGVVWVEDRIIALQVGDCVADLWSETKAALKEGQKSGLEKRPVDGGRGGLDIRPLGGLDIRPEWPSFKAGNPIPTVPQNNPEASSGSTQGVDGDKTPTAEGSLASFTTPQLPSPSSLEKKEPPLPPVASATAKSHVALATVNGRVAGDTNPYGYGTEIAGLNEYTDDVVDRVVAMQAGIITNKDPAWTTVLGAVRETSPNRVMAAVLDLEATHAAGKLRSPVLRALRGFAAAISEEDAAAKLEEATKPRPRVSPLVTFGLSR